MGCSPGTPPTGEAACPRSTPWTSASGPLRRGGQPGAGILLPPAAALGRPAHRRRLGLPVVAGLSFERDSWVAPRTRGASARRKTLTRWPWLR